VIDMYVKTESERLLYISLRQTKIKVDGYIHLKHAVVNDGNANHIGRLVKLFCTFTRTVASSENNFNA
jgi:hypothetical protein